MWKFSASPTIIEAKHTSCYNQLKDHLFTFRNRLVKPGDKSALRRKFTFCQVIREHTLQTSILSLPDIRPESINWLRIFSRDDGQRYHVALREIIYFVNLLGIFRRHKEILSIVWQQDKSCLLIVFLHWFPILVRRGAYESISTIWLHYCKMDKKRVICNVKYNTDRPKIKICNKIKVTCKLTHKYALSVWHPSNVGLDDRQYLD